MALPASCPARPRAARVPLLLQQLQPAPASPRQRPGAAAAAAAAAVTAEAACRRLRYRAAAVATPEAACHWARSRTPAVAARAAAAARVCPSRRNLTAAAVRRKQHAARWQPLQ